MPGESRRLILLTEPGTTEPYGASLPHRTADGWNGVASTDTGFPEKSSRLIEELLRPVPAHVCDRTACSRPRPAGSARDRPRCRRPAALWREAGPGARCGGVTARGGARPRARG